MSGPIPMRMPRSNAKQKSYQPKVEEVGAFPCRLSSHWLLKVASVVTGSSPPLAFPHDCRKGTFL